MFVSRVSPVSNSSNIVPTRVSTKRKCSPNPSFGIRLGQKTGRLVREQLSEHERHFFSQMIDQAARNFEGDSENLAFWTDCVWSKMVGRALQLRSWRRELRRDPATPMPISLSYYSWDWNWNGGKKAA